MACRSFASALACGLVLAGVSVVASAGDGLQAPKPQVTLDVVLAAYMSGDTGVVARTFTTSADFQARRLGNPRHIERWLGTWHRGKAALLLEMANASTAMAPQYVRPLVTAGRRYVLAPRPAPSPDGPDEAFLILWHRIAAGLLLRSATPALVETYVDGLIGPPGNGTATGSIDPRLQLARAVAHERRCGDVRPDRDRPGADLRRLARAAGNDLPGPGDLTSSPRAIVASRFHTCLGEAIARFEAAAAGDAHAEARVRAGWLLFQQGDAPHALEWLDGADPAGDRDLTYWRSLFRGRVLDALGRYQDAADAYGSALAAHPGAQSAGVGLALALFRLDRAEEAEALAQSLRSRMPAVDDPWWNYAGADQRFVERWLAELRGVVR